MASLTSSLIVRVLDQASAPARAIARNLLGISRAADQAGRGGFGDRLNAAISANNRALDRARGQMVDTIASVYALRTALGAPINAAMKFESAMADIAKVSGFDDKGLDVYGKRLRKLAVTEIPLAVNDLAALSAAAAQAGVPDADLFDFTRLTAKAAVAWEMSGAEAGEALAKIRTALGLTNEQTAAYADAVNYVSDSTASSSRDLIDFTKRVASQGEFFGFAKEQTLAFGAAMISAGSESEVAATSFRNMGRALTRGASATKAQRGAWKRLGMDAVKVAKAMQKDAVGTTVKVIESLGKLPEHMQASVMSDLFGDEARALAPLLNNTELLRKALALTADEQKYLNSVGKEFEKRAATSEYKLQRFKSQLADIGLTVGAALLPALNKLLIPMGEMALRVSDWTEAHPELIRNVIAATAAVVGFRAAVVSLKWLGLIGRGGALSMIALAFNTLGRAAIGATVAVRSATGLQRALAAMQGVQPSRMQTLAAALKGMVLAIPGMGTLSTALGTVAGALATISAPAWGAIALGALAVAGAGALIYKYWDRLTSVFSGVSRAIGEQLAPVFDKIREKIAQFQNFIREGVGNLAEYLGVDAAKAQEAFDAVLNSMFDFSGIKAKLTEFCAWVGSFFVREVLSEDQKAEWGTFGYDAANRMIEAIKSLFSGFVAWAGDIGGKIGDAIASRATKALDSVRGWFGGGTPQIAPMQSTGDLAGDMQRALDIAKQLAALRQANEATTFGVSSEDTKKLEALEESYRSAIEGLPQAAQAEMEAYVSALANGGDQASIEADRIASRIVQSLNLTVTPLVDTSSITRALSDIQRLENALRSAGGSAVSWVTHNPKASPTPIAGARARGGPVAAGKSYLVGEEGPELFHPDQAGTIVPAGETARMVSGETGGRGAAGSKIEGLLEELRSFSADERALTREAPAPVLAPSVTINPAVTVTISGIQDLATALRDAESELGRMVRRIMEEEVRALLRGIHADAGVLG